MVCKNVTMPSCHVLPQRHRVLHSLRAGGAGAVRQPPCCSSSHWHPVPCHPQAPEPARPPSPADAHKIHALFGGDLEDGDPQAPHLEELPLEELPLRTLTNHKIKG